MLYPYLSMLIPIFFGILLLILNLKESRRLKLFAVTLAIAASLAFVIVSAIDDKHISELIPFSDTLGIVFETDGLSKLFALTTNLIWLFVAVYSFGYMKREQNENLFYGFMLITLGVLNALWFSGNLLTMYLCFELATLASMPMVLSSLSKEAIKAAQKYLFYSIGGAFLALFGIVVLYSKGLGDGIFGVDTVAIPTDDPLVLTAMLMMIIGFGTKAGMYPMHGWLPTAHPVAPSPASALLSGLIAEAGVFAVIRVTRCTPVSVKGTWVQYVWLVLALITVFIGSMMAYREKHIKKRLAYSTVSQVSYMMAGLACCNSIAFYGAILHYIFHAIIKTALFMSAGSIIMQTGKTNVDELEGVGKEMPVTMWGYTLASLGLIGIPPACGFFSKYYLCVGALGDAGLGAFGYIIPAVLIISALLTAGYLLPVTVKGFFPNKDFIPEKRETGAVMYIPLILLGVLTFLASLLVENLSKLI